MIGSDEQLRALGLLTLDFGAADEGLADYISSFLGFLMKDSPNSMGQLQELNFSGKVKHFRTIIEFLSDRYRVDGTRLFQQLDAVREIARDPLSEIRRNHFGVRVRLTLASCAHNLKTGLTKYGRPARITFYNCESL
jgi:hypothetical protein